MIDITNLSNSDLSRLKLPSKVTSGVVVRSAQAGMPAAGKLQNKDVITKVMAKTFPSK